MIDWLVDLSVQIFAGSEIREELELCKTQTRRISLSFSESQLLKCIAHTIFNILLLSWNLVRQVSNFPIMTGVLWPHSNIVSPPLPTCCRELWQKKRQSFRSVP